MLLIDVHVYVPRHVLEYILEYVHVLCRALLSPQPLSLRQLSAGVSNSRYLLFNLLFLFSRVQRHQQPASLYYDQYTTHMAVGLVVWTTRTPRLVRHLLPSLPSDHHMNAGRPNW